MYVFYSPQSSKQTYKEEGSRHCPGTLASSRKEVLGEVSWKEGWKAAGLWGRKDVPVFLLFLAAAVISKQKRNKREHGGVFHKSNQNSWKKAHLENVFRVPRAMILCLREKQSLLAAPACPPLAGCFVRKEALQTLRHCWDCSYRRASRPYFLWD